MLPLHAPSPSSFLLLLLLPAMVRYSNKQVILNDIVHTLEVSIPAKMEQNANRMLHSCSTDIDDLDDNVDPLPISRHLVCLYTFICKHRYTISHYNPLGCANKLINFLDSNSDRMSLNRVQETLSVALSRLGCSGNGGGEHDAALQCCCSVGSIVAYTNHTVAGLLKLNNEVMQFALEEERKHAAACVHNTTGVEEWGKGWLVVDGTHIPLAWKPRVHSQEHFCYKGFHSMNVVLVILPHSLQIVESVVGQPGSIQDSKVWASGSNILKKPHLYLDEGEFIWVDGGYGHSAITVGPFSHTATNKSQDLQYFNCMLS
ncbi:uncharacterized protein UBRO_21069 [Ustilago bromivora]|uniref:DDE Tnp4 domain-containing protein n=1 Tax=Ustilago bromivora TaxID=307758 RepID=A0A1K0H4P0_9BASI|nr:uncharacterized protein UBRO_21069 [Ustilago bromivora]